MEKCKMLVYHREYPQIIFVTREPELSLLLQPLFQKSCGGAEFAPDAYTDLATMLKNVEILDPSEQTSILEKLANDCKLQLSKGVLQNLNFRLRKYPPILEAFKERCKQFFFLSYLYKEYSGLYEKAFKKEHQTIERLYNASTLRDEYIVCAEGKPRQSRMDLQVIELTCRIFADDLSNFQEFTKGLVDSIGRTANDANQKKLVDKVFGGFEQ